MANCEICGQPIPPKPGDKPRSTAVRKTCWVEGNRRSECAKALIGQVQRTNEARAARKARRDKEYCQLYKSVKIKTEPRSKPLADAIRDRELDAERLRLIKEAGDMETVKVNTPVQVGLSRDVRFNWLWM